MAQHRQERKNRLPWWAGLTIGLVLVAVVAGCLAATVWALFHGDPSVQPAIQQ